MPKIKTRRAAAKRFSLTGSGKFKRRRQNLRHGMTNKSAERKMRLGQSTLVDQTNERLCAACCPTASKCGLLPADGVSSLRFLVPFTEHIDLLGAEKRGFLVSEQNPCSPGVERGVFSCRSFLRVGGARGAATDVQSRAPQ